MMVNSMMVIMIAVVTVILVVVMVVTMMIIAVPVMVVMIESFRFDYDYDYEIIYSNLLLNHVIFLRFHHRNNRYLLFLWPSRTNGIRIVVVTKMTTKFVTNHVVK